MNYENFAQLLEDRYSDFCQRWPLSSFVLDHYLRANLLQRPAIINQHRNYLQQTIRYGKIVDLLSRGFPKIIKNSDDKPSVLLAAPLIFSFPWLAKEVRDHNSSKLFTLNFFGLAKYYRQLRRMGYSYASLFDPLFKVEWSKALGQGMKTLTETDRMLSWSGWDNLELLTEQTVSGLTTRLSRLNCVSVVMLRDFFWYEAALILACKRAAIPCHVVAHGYPHCDPENSECFGYLPFRGDTLYCMSEESYHQLSPWVEDKHCYSVRLFSNTQKVNGEGILFISSSVEEVGLLDDKYRLAVYKGLQAAANKLNCRVTVRFRDDEQLDKKIKQAESFNFRWTVKNNISLDEDLKNNRYVFGFGSTALFLSHMLGHPTYNVSSYGSIDGVENIVPEKIPDVVSHVPVSLGFVDNRTTFADIFWKSLLHG
ncbi:hypothetical protein GeomeDRAFT_0277 [Geobacter metallireducens RCH3]|uniref:Uncharacterized protein n=1 Tax=Geobacter metallireducens (strain ATCC 53774 / DSM 7210 / GS-15) TaxID=269799 RepID=Q39VT1_GEOMG|nr:hypothetical protein [Geobacter metallireducens]ABB31643.1 hypothetical protein Gmet_1409 [Geobacter metallireducens GS-15]EHP89479.1 hypothetical protein GeomeDRAFT_0277 [Geobacter metallireducens RCH3]